MTVEIKLSAYSVQSMALAGFEGHPLDVLYHSVNEDTQYNRGHFAFAGDDLNKSSAFDDVSVIWLEFFGEEDNELDREAWADPLRAALLRRLSVALNLEWCLDVKGDVSDPKAPHGYLWLDEYIDANYIVPNHLQSTHVTMPLPFQKTFESRLIVRYPATLISAVVQDLWPLAYPGAPIEGYLMPQNGISIINDWELRDRSVALFDDILNTCELLFTTVPSEHRHFVFFTRKISAERFMTLIDLEEMQQTAEAVFNDSLSA